MYFRKLEITIHPRTDAPEEIEKRARIILEAKDRHAWLFERFRFRLVASIADALDLAEQAIEIRAVPQVHEPDTHELVLHYSAATIDRVLEAPDSFGATITAIVDRAISEAIETIEQISRRGNVTLVGFLTHESKTTVNLMPSNHEVQFALIASGPTEVVVNGQTLEVSWNDRDDDGVSADLAISPADPTGFAIAFARVIRYHLVRIVLPR